MRKVVTRAVRKNHSQRGACNVTALSQPRVIATTHAMLLSVRFCLLFVRGRCGDYFFITHMLT